MIAIFYGRTNNEVGNANTPNHSCVQADISSERKWRLRINFSAVSCFFSFSFHCIFDVAELLALCKPSLWGHGLRT